MWSSPRTWVTADLVTAALMNTHVRDNLLFLYSNVTVATIDHTASPYAAASGIVLCNTAGGNIEVDLPAVASSSNLTLYVKNSGAGTVTLDGNAGELVEGEGTQTLLDGDCALLVCNGVAWYLI